MSTCTHLLHDQHVVSHTGVDHLEADRTRCLHIDSVDADNEGVSGYSDEVIVSFEDLGRVSVL